MITLIDWTKVTSETKEIVLSKLNEVLVKLDEITEKLKEVDK